MIKIAVLGCGRIGRMHALNIAAHPQAVVAGVFDVNRSAADEIGALLGVRVFETAEAVFGDGNVDAVLVATSTPTHADYIEMSIAAGMPVLCEKPIDLSLDRVRVCARKIAGATVPIMLGFVRRFDPGHRALHDALRNGDIGNLHQVVITSRDPGLAPVAYLEASGGIFRDMTIHDFDMARFILGEEIEEVFATGSRLLEPDLMASLGDFDTVSVVLRTGSGRQCIINNARQATYGYDQRVEALGDRGMLISENRRPNMVTLHRTEFTGQGAPLMNFFIDRYAEAFAAEIGAFVEAIEAGVAPEVGFEDGEKALVLAEAAIRSVEESRAVSVKEIGS
jgi:myo-inositol 2-dehydrogenase/D-chiro-inositol 1-dehydrogenase